MFSITLRKGMPFVFVVVLCVFILWVMTGGLLYSALVIHFSLQLAPDVYRRKWCLYLLLAMGGVVELPLYIHYIQSSSFDKVTLPLGIARTKF